MVTKNEIQTLLEKTNLINQLKIQKIGKKFGESSEFGNVYELHVLNKENKIEKNKYVLKVMMFRKRRRTPDLLNKIFDNEVCVGLNPELWKKRIGPSILGWKKTKDFGIFVMNNLIDGRKDIKLFDLFSFTRKSYINKKALNKKILTKLLMFYKTTKRFHGDLHKGNIIIAWNKQLKSIQEIFIIDYGASLDIFQKNYNNIKNYFKNFQTFLKKGLKSKRIVKKRSSNPKFYFLKSKSGTQISQSFRDNKKMIFKNISSIIH